MSAVARPDVADQLRRAVTTIRDLKGEVAALRRERAGPIAIVGLACRFPGGDGPEAFWDLLERGGDAVRTVPPERWDADAWFDPDPDAPGRMNSRHGAFLPGIDRFDADVFDLSAREAAAMDPQQRLLLEVGHEAFEDAAIAPGAGDGPTGVYVGINAQEYYQRAIANAAAIEAHSLSGGVASVAVGRLSYLFGLDGPAVAVDTACSSSLVAVHLAVQALRTGDVRAALAGGVYTVLDPHLSVGLSKLHMLAPDGRCKTFDARADGFVQGEGCGLVLLKRLDDALADGDPIRAVIRGCAVNQDGRSGSLTAPSQRAQVRVMSDALRDAGLSPAAVGYVETHGTGTALGDPIEVHALCEALSAASEIVLGAVKTNIGHLGPAAGIAGLVKATLALQARRIPRNLHFEVMNPSIAPTAQVILPDRTVTFPERDGRCVAAVSSFGFSGTNAHAVLEAAPEPQQPTLRPDARHVLCLSARSEAALTELLRRTAARLRQGADADADADALVRTAAIGRRHFEHRAAVAARAPALADALGAAVPQRAAERPRLAFLFTGQGAWPSGLGAVIAGQSARAAKVLERCAERVPAVRPALFEDGVDLADTRIAQPALVALQWSLVEAFAQIGVRPHAVAGHSAGEIAAAAAAGALAWEDALAFAAARGEAMARLPRGAMAAVAASASVANDAIGEHYAAVGIAAENGPRATVLSGEEAALSAVLSVLEGRGIATRRLDVSHAFHSPAMAPALRAIEEAADRLDPQRPSTAFVSTLTGAAMDRLGADHFVRHALQPVRFGAAVDALQQGGATVFVEIGPGRTLAGLAAAAGAANPIAALDAQGDLGEAIAALYRAGLSIDFRPLVGPGPRGALPRYPFQRRRHWKERAAAEDGPGALWPPGQRESLPYPGTHHRLRLSLAAFPFLGDHRVHGRAVVPGAFQLAAMIGAIAPGEREPAHLSDIVFLRPLIAPEDGDVTVWTVVEPSGTVRVVSDGGAGGLSDQASARASGAWPAALGGTRNCLSAWSPNAGGASLRRWASPSDRRSAVSTHCRADQARRSRPCALRPRRGRAAAASTPPFWMPAFRWPAQRPPMAPRRRCFRWASTASASSARLPSR